MCLQEPILLKIGCVISALIGGHRHERPDKEGAQYRTLKVGESSGLDRLRS